MEEAISTINSLLKRIRSRWLWVLFLLCAGVLVLVFLRLGTWLVKEDPLEKADAIVVLSGGLPIRAQEAARIFAQGHAKEVWLTQPLEPRASMEALGIPYEGEERYSKAILERAGVPPGSIEVLPTPILNTADEIRAMDLRLAGGRGKTIIVVTSKAHTRRVHLLWKRLAGTGNRVVVRAASGDSFDPGHWWRTTHDALDVVRETLGLANAWAGLPLRPSN